MPNVAEPAANPMEVLGQIAHGYLISSALNAITRLEVADILKDDSLTVDELAIRTSTNKDALCRVLRLLSCIGVFEEVLPETFANNDASKLTMKDAENSQRDMLLFVCDPFHFKAYADMLPTIRDGKTAVEHIWGKGIFDVFAEMPEEQKNFDNAMTSFSKRAIPEILRVYDFTGIGKLVDVAGGHGAMLSAILNNYPNMRGVLFDLPHVTEGGIECMKKQHLSERCEVVGGDFFKSVPSGDAIIMKHIIHDWDDKEAIVILNNCREAVGKGGKILLVEMILSGMNELHPSKFLDIEMLMLPGGRERTEEQFAELFKKAGLKLAQVVGTRGPWSVIEATVS